MTMPHPLQASQALDNQPLGTQIVASMVDDDGTASGQMLQHALLPDGTRVWSNLTVTDRQPFTARDVVTFFDDMVITRIGEAPAREPAADPTLEAAIVAAERYEFTGEGATELLEHVQALDKHSAVFINALLIELVRARLPRS